MTVFLDLMRNEQFRCIVLVQLLTVFSTNLLTPVMPVYFKLQGLSEGQIGLAMGVVSLGALVVRPYAGKMVDQQGSRLTIFWGQGLTLAAMAAFLWATGFWPLLLVRLMQGVAMAFYGTGAVTFASGAESMDKVTAAVAFFSLFTMIGLGLGTSCSPWFYGLWGFASLVLVGLLTLGAGGILMYTASRPIPVAKSGKRVSFGVILSQPKVLVPSVCLFASNFSLGTAFVFVPLLALHQGSDNSGVFFAAFSVAVISARMGVQYMTTHFKQEWTAIYASLLNAASVLLLALIPTALTFGVAGILIGFGFGTIYPTLAGYLIQRVSPINKGSALSIFSGAGDVGNALGGAVLGVIAEWYGFRVVFLAAAAVVLVCTYIFFKALVRESSA
ncbi:MAG TPA: MFS transporter, partial [Patescibacteria group bacterium]|nr:MFS transporter [Patescibacteria group bacterium]